MAGKSSGLRQEFNDTNQGELHRIIWNLSDNLRGQIDGWDFKNYILGFLFFRYLSEETARNVEHHTQGKVKAEEYHTLADNDKRINLLLQSSGLYPQSTKLLPPSKTFQALFKTLKESKDSSLEVRDLVQQSFAEIETHPGLSNVFSTLDLGDTKLGTTKQNRNERLKKIVLTIGSADLRIDRHLIGDLYEKLIRMYATDAGKSGGEFYTPPCISELLASLALKVQAGTSNVYKIYDPAFGSGSLLLTTRRKATRSSSIYGQEINLTTYNLARMNMRLHNVYARLEHGDTLEQDMFPDEKFDIIVANPPFSVHGKGKDNPKHLTDPRFWNSPLAPKTRGDFAFIQHSLYKLKPEGCAAIVCFPGLLYRGGSEAEIRKWMVDNNYVNTVIQLPEDVFYGTQIATCILVLQKQRKDKNVLFIDAQEFFTKSLSKKVLEERDLKKLMELFQERKDVPRFAKVATLEQIAKKGYGLSPHLYIDIEESKEEAITSQEVAQTIEDIDKGGGGLLLRTYKLRKGILQLLENPKDAKLARQRMQEDDPKGLESWLLRIIEDAKNSKD